MTAVLVLLITPKSCLAAINYSSIVGATVTENFDTLQSNRNTDNVAFTNDTTLTGWFLHRVTSSSDPTPVAVDRYDTSDGGTMGDGTTDGRFYSFGVQSTAERAFGAVGNASFGTDASQATGLADGQVTGWLAVSITNTSGVSFGSFSIGFNGEQWSKGASNATASTMTLEYGFGNTFAGVTTWTVPGGNFDWTTPVVNGGGQAAVDGNVAGRVNSRGGTVGSLNWAPSTTLWVRWVEVNNAGVDHAMGIDDFSFSASAQPVPEPAAILFGSLVCGVVGLAYGARKWLGTRRGGRVESAT